MTVVTRFPPSPTGFLHVGSARTALYNWLYARHCGGKFVLRIEDTDRKRSTQEAIDAIIDGLKWLELDWDGDIVFQTQNAERHAAVAQTLLEQGKAYKCYCTPEELAEMREAARQEGRPVLYDGRWRDRNPAEAPPGVDPVVRIKMPRDGETTIADLVQGDVTVANAQLDDFILLRADGTPTYMLSVVVDDHDMGVTHIIRGDDHLNNAFRQLHLFEANGWPVPAFGHIPLIHGADGQKLSKRHGALGVEAYRDMGILPEALRNYLLRLGWSHGDDEIISTAQAIEWFDIDDVGRSPARFDLAKLESLNSHYLRQLDDGDLAARVAPIIAERLGATVDDIGQARLQAGMDGLKPRAKTLVDLADSGAFYVVRPTYPLANAKAAKLLTDDAAALLTDLMALIAPLDPWQADALEAAIRRFAEDQSVGLGKVAQPLRAALTGSNASPGIFEVMEILGREESAARIAGVPGVPKTT
ncbi:MAG: glutamate--tRNA ligase [Alphaproteobacteria bacterium]|nr:glutamate--tRNA ligase [Alphaproteobacteria bacterium]